MRLMEKTQRESKNKSQKTFRPLWTKSKHVVFEFVFNTQIRKMFKTRYVLKAPNGKKPARKKKSQQLAPIQVGG